MREACRGTRKGGGGQPRTGRNLHSHRSLLGTWATWALRGQRIVYMSENPSPGRLLSCQLRTCLDPHSPGGQRTAASSPVLDGQTTWDIYLQQDSL